MEGSLRNRTYRMKLSGHLAGVSMVKGGVPQCSVLGAHLFQVFISDLAGELICYHLFFANFIKLIAS